MREFIFSDDFAAACVFLIENYDEERIINVGVGEDVSMAELAGLVAGASGFKGDIVWDTTKPDGALRKLLDSSRMCGMGWNAKVGFKEGLSRVFDA